MFGRLLLLFTLVPMVELAILIMLTRYTSLVTTVLTVLGTGMLGAALARRQGFRAWQSVQQQLAQGKIPSQELLDGAMIVLAGTFLITPGLLTDTCGFCLLLPRFRRWVGQRLLSWFLQNAKSGLQSSGSGGWTFQMHSGGFSTFAGSGNTNDRRTDEASVRVIDPQTKKIGE